MKILVIDIAAKTGGALTIIDSFYKESLEDKQNEYIFLLSRDLEERSSESDIIIMKKQNWLSRLYFDFIGAKKIVKKYNIEKVISFQNTMPRLDKCFKILYMHQAIPFQKEKKFSFLKKKEFNLAIRQHLIGYLIKRSLLKSDKIIVQTNWIKKAIIRECSIDKDKIKVVVPRVLLNNNNNSKKCEINNDKFFYPTSDYVYKNNELVEKVATKLIEDGINDFQIDLTIDGKNCNNINYIGRIDKERLLEKYRTSILIFPSYIETLGLPILEAKKVGTIILASDTEFSHELLDDYENAYFFNPFKYEELYELIKKCIMKDIEIKKIKNYENNKNLNSKRIIDIVNEL